MQILNSVSDIVRIKEPSAEDLYDDYEAVIKYVEKLRDDILDLEAKHKREDFVEFNEVKSRLTSFMEEVFSKGRSFKENYQTKAVSGLDSFADYNTALMAAESYIESTQERYEKALAAEAIRIEKLKAEQRIVDGLKQTAWALVDVAAIGLAIMSGGTLAPISVAILTFSAAEITEGAGNIYLGITGDGSSIAFNPIRDTLFMGNQDVYNVASLAVNIADMKLSKPKVSSLDDIARFGAKSVEAKGINRVKDLTKKLLGKVDDVGDVKKGGKGVSAADEAVEAVGKGSKAVGKGGINTIDMSKYSELSNAEVIEILKTRGLDECAINDLITSFDGPIYKRTGYEGEVFTITESKVGDASGVFVTRGSAGSTPAERINNLALPPNNSALIESKVELTRTQILLEGIVAPQREWALIANDGIPRTGGAWQVITDGGKYSDAIRR